MNTPRKPKISTITPCYKMKPYLKKFLEELPRQTIFEDIQVVLDHNDPDADEVDWVTDFCVRHPGRLKHIITRPVAPIGVSMNTCIKQADADIVAIWNVDDLRSPDSLEKQYEVFAKDTKEIVSVVHGNFLVVKSFGALTGELVDHRGPTYDNPSELTRSMVYGPFFAFRKKLVEQIGWFDEQLKSGADFDMVIRLSLTGTVKIVDGILGYYLNEGKGASTNGDGKQPTERTVIELRYGIHDKVEEKWLPIALSGKYDIRHIVNHGKHVPLKSLIQDYDSFIKRNDFRK